MKKVILTVLALGFVSTASVADEYHPPFTCGANSCDQGTMSVPARADNDYFYASVESRSHMDLELVLLLKDTAHRFNTKVLGGSGARFDVKKYQDLEVICKNSNDTTDLNWLNSHIATHHVGGYSSSFSATYVICLFDRGTSGPYSRLMNAAIVSNSEVGD